MLPLGLRLQAPANDDPIVVGLVNNMPDAALRTTERQFSELLSLASHSIPVRLRLFSLPEVPRGDAGRAHIDTFYEDIAELASGPLDGLIVTGTVPRTPVLADEPYWPALTRLIDWAEDHTVSTVWSCLAAHAAALHTEGIDRRALGPKLSGVFECAKASEHAIMAGVPLRWRVPHSRYNELPEAALVSAGHRILSRSPEAGADMFIKQRRRSLFFYIQGHPEYDPGALFREYRRDVGAFLAGERADYPDMPRGYFDDEAVAALGAFRQRALRQRSRDLLQDFPSAAVEAKLGHGWRGPAARIYANWLSFLAARTARRVETAAHSPASPRTAPQRQLAGAALRSS